MRGLRLILAPAALAAMLLALPGASQAQVEGAWVVTSWETADGETLDQPQPGLFVFTENHYSIMYVNTAEARAGYTGESMTDEEVLAAYGTFIANSGRYSIDGNEITTQAFVAKDPNYMGGWPENQVTYTFRMEGETLHLTMPDGTKATFRQVDGLSMGG